MPILFFYTIVNAIVNVREVQNKFRISLGMVQVGILEATVAIGVIAALFFGGFTKSKTPTDKTHPVYVLTMLLLLVGFACGIVGALMHDGSPHFKMVFMREFFGMPASVFVGYHLVGTLRSARKFPLAMVIGGVAVTFLMMAAFGQGAERYESKGDWGALRTTNYVTNYSGVASGVLLYSVLAGLRLVRPAVALVLSGFCFVGQLTPLHRSDWLAQAACMAAIPFCLPPGERIKQSLRLFLASIAMAISLWAGLHVASAATGRNFHKTFEDRLMSMLPGERLKVSDAKAWDTRLPAIRKELGMWLTNPIMGRGFAFQESLGWGGAAEVGFGYHHNAYTSTLAQTGLIGMAGVMLAVWAPVFIGFRMVRDRFDRGSMLIGGLGIIAGVQQGILGMATASFNGYRLAMMIGLISGVVFRVRDMQRTKMRLAQEYGLPYGPNIDPDDPMSTPGGLEIAPIPDFDDYGRPIIPAHPGEYPTRGSPSYN